MNGIISGKTAIESFRMSWDLVWYNNLNLKRDQGLS